MLDYDTSIEKKVEQLKTLSFVGDELDVLRIKQPRQSIENRTYFNPFMQLKKIGKGDHTGIPSGIKSQFEEASGFSFDDVRVHYNSSKPQKIEALAYTRGNEVYIGPGQEKHLIHELGHVVQQKQGIVRPTMQKNGMLMNADESLEQEAERWNGLDITKANEISDANFGEKNCSQINVVQCCPRDGKKNAQGNGQAAQNKSADIKGVLNFEPNDLLYGTTNDRRSYCRTLDKVNDFYQTQTGQLSHMKLDFPIIVDYMNNSFLGTEDGQEYGDETTENPDVKATTKYKIFHDYFDQYFKSRIAQLDTPGKRIEQGCKFGIWLTVNMGHTIHFALDSLYTSPIQECIAKGQANQYTSKELRYIHTNYSDSKFKNNVKFYNNSNAVKAPWVDPFSKEWTNAVAEQLPLKLPKITFVELKKIREIVQVIQNQMNQIAVMVVRRGEIINTLVEVNDKIKDLSEHLMDPQKGETIRKSLRGQYDALKSEHDVLNSELEELDTQLKGLMESHRNLLAEHEAMLNSI